MNFVFFVLGALTGSVGVLIWIVGSAVKAATDRKIAEDDNDNVEERK